MNVQLLRKIPGQASFSVSLLVAWFVMQIGVVEYRHLVKATHTGWKPGQPGVSIFGLYGAIINMIVFTSGLLILGSVVLLFCKKRQNNSWRDAPWIVYYFAFVASGLYATASNAAGHLDSAPLAVITIFIALLIATLKLAGTSEQQTQTSIRAGQIH